MDDVARASGVRLGLGFFRCPSSKYLFLASACIRVKHTDASEMARRRWENVSPGQRTKLARAAALARWANATEDDRGMARTRAAHARELRTRKLAAKLLGVEFSKLADVSVKVISRSEFRSRKSQEQNEYWKTLREDSSVRVTCVNPDRARDATIVHPASFRMVPAGSDESRSSAPSNYRRRL